ncbi:MAG: hypothetical protein U0U67_02755 [Chitinophagales bacterium]
MVNKLYIFLFTLISVSFSSNAQDISGRWVGGHFNSSKITLDLFQHKDSITGIGYVEFPDDIGNAIIYIEGNISNGVLEYQSSKILEQNIDSNFSLCFVLGKEQLKIKKNKMILEGSCVSIDKKEECFSLSALEKYTKKKSFDFRKNDFIGRKVLALDTVFVTNDTVELIIWDNLKEDGDVVSIYLNEEKLISNYTLKHVKKRIPFVCKTDISEIILFAQNLGSEPPNTASVSIVQKNKVLKELILKSDLNKSESIIIKRE